MCATAGKQHVDNYIIRSFCCLFSLNDDPMSDCNIEDCRRRHFESVDTNNSVRKTERSKIEILRQKGYCPRLSLLGADYLTSEFTLSSLARANTKKKCRKSFFTLSHCFPFQHCFAFHDVGKPLIHQLLF